MSNEKIMKCSVCGKDTKAGSEAVVVTCGECTNAGKHKHVKTYFKDSKLNKKEDNVMATKEKKEPKAAIKTEPKKRFGITDYVIGKISEGKTKEEITESIKKDIPEYTGNIKNIFGLNKCREAFKNAKGEK